MTWSHGDPITTLRDSVQLLQKKGKKKILRRKPVKTTAECETSAAVEENRNGALRKTKSRTIITRRVTWEKEDQLVYRFTKTSKGEVGSVDTYVSAVQ